MLLLMEHHNAHTLMCCIRVCNLSGENNSKGTSAAAAVEPVMKTWYCTNLSVLDRLHAHTFEVDVTLIEHQQVELEDRPASKCLAGMLT